MFSVGAPDSTLGRIFNGSGFITVLLILSILLAASMPTRHPSTETKLQMVLVCTSMA